MCVCVCVCVWKLVGVGGGTSVWGNCGRGVVGCVGLGGGRDVGKEGSGGKVWEVGSEDGDIGIQGKGMNGKGSRKGREGIEVGRGMGWWMWGRGGAMWGSGMGKQGKRVGAGG